MSPVTVNAISAHAILVNAIIERNEKAEMMILDSEGLQDPWRWHLLEKESGDPRYDLSSINKLNVGLNWMK